MKKNFFAFAASLLVLSTIAFPQEWLTAGQVVVETWTSGKPVYVALSTQTGAASYLTIPDLAGTADEFTFKTKAQTLSNKTFVAPVLGAASASSLALNANQNTYAGTVTLTEAGGAELFITFTSANTATFGIELKYKVSAADATPDYAAREGSIRLVCVNKATAVTCTKDAADQSDDESVLIATNSKTLTYAIALDVVTANLAKLTINIDSDMTSTSASMTWTAIVNGPAVAS